MPKLTPEERKQRKKEYNKSYREKMRLDPEKREKEAERFRAYRKRKKAEALLEPDKSSSLSEKRKQQMREYNKSYREKRKMEVERVQRYQKRERAEIVSQAETTLAKPNLVPYCDSSSKEKAGPSDEKQNLALHIDSPSEEKQNIVTHINVPSEEKQNIVSHIDAPSDKKQNLVSHINVPSEEKQNIVTHIDAPSEEKQNIVTHIDAPSEEKQNIVTHIDAPSEEKQNIVTHINVPSEEKQNLVTHIDAPSDETQNIVSHIDSDSEDDWKIYSPSCPPLGTIPTSPPQDYPHICDRAWRDAFRRANAEQTAFIKHVRYQLRYGKEPMRILTQGVAGTGKSFVISLVAKLVQQLRGPGSVMLTAPTGKAAYAIGGCTLHAALSIPVRNNAPLSALKLKRLREQYAQVALLVIDEVSMLGSSLFHKVNQRWQDIRQCDTLFGGLHVLLFGDFYQLEPVCDLSLIHNELMPHFQFRELTENMRQKEDPEFFQLLQDLRKNTLSEAQRQILRTRVVPEEKVPPDAIWLYHTNRKVNEANQKKLRGRCVVSCPAIDTAKKDGTVTRSDSLLPELPLVIGFRYMITRNLDVARGIVNGYVGVLQHIERKGNYIHRIVLNNAHQTVRLHRIRQTVYRDGSVVGRRQFPCKMAEAMTVHASQGSTLNPIRVEGFTNLTHLYVALSRCCKREQVYMGKEVRIPRGNVSHVNRWLDAQRV